MTTFTGKLLLTALAMLLWAVLCIAMINLTNDFIKFLDAHQDRNGVCRGETK